MDILEIARHTVERAQSLGCTASEAYVLEASSLSIEVNNQEVENLKLAQINGIGLKTIVNGRLGFAYSSTLDKNSLIELVDNSLANAKETSPDEHNVLPKSQGPVAELDLYDPFIAKTPVEEKIEQAKLVERTAKEYDSRIERVRKSSYQDSEYRVALVNSQGVESSYLGNYCGVGAFVLAGENNAVQTGWSMDLARKYGSLKAEMVGKEAAHKAVTMLGATTVSSQRVPIILDSYIATNFLDIIAPSFTAEAVQKNKSLFAGKMGNQLASSLVTIIDDGRLENGIDSSPVDGEGVPTSRNILLNQGRLEKYLYNAYTASKDGVLSTGSGNRSSYKGMAEVSTTNFFIAPGQISVEELIGPVEKGFYITEVMGLHTANPISGDFSLGASGIWIEKGQKTKGIRGVAIAGNILDLLKDIDGVGNDLRFYGSTGSPTLRIAKMSISGS